MIDEGYECDISGCKAKSPLNIDMKPHQSWRDCYDGNEEDGDGCSSFGKVEDGWWCNENEKCYQDQGICGDGILNGNEECDDGWGLNSACSFTCKLLPDATQTELKQKIAEPLKNIDLVSNAYLGLLLAAALIVVMYILGNFIKRCCQYYQVGQLFRYLKVCVLNLILLHVENMVSYFQAVQNHLRMNETVH